MLCPPDVVASVRAFYGATPFLGAQTRRANQSNPIPKRGEETCEVCFLQPSSSFDEKAMYRSIGVRSVSYRVSSKDETGRERSFSSASHHNTIQNSKRHALANAANKLGTARQAHAPLPAPANNRPLGSNTAFFSSLFAGRRSEKREDRRLTHTKIYISGNN